MTTRQTLPRRDLLLLPLVCLMTIILMIGTAELLTHIFYPEEESGVCRVPDPVLGYRNKPNCSEPLKAMEAGPVVNHYNDCGYRTEESCGPKPPGSLRIALIGSSTGQGHFVSYEDSMGERLSQALTSQCRRPVEVQNLAATQYYFRQVEARATDALKLNPDLVIWIVSPYDIQVSDSAPPRLERAPTEQPTLLLRLHSALLESRAFSVLQHFYYESEPNYVSLFLLNSDKAGFLFSDIPPTWRQRIATFNTVVGTIAHEADAAGVPFAIAFVPQRAQAALAHMPPREGIDPYAINHAIEEIARAQGVSFIDTMPDLEKNARDPGKLFLPLDGHLNAQGDPLVGRSIAYHLLAMRVGDFASCSAMQSLAAGDTN